MGSAYQYAVLNASDTEPNILILAGVFCECNEMPRVDAQRIARRSQYVFGISEKREDAETLSRALAGQGIASVIVPAGYITVLGEPRIISNADCLPDRFEIQSGSGHALPIDWPEVAMISYGHVRHEAPLRPPAPIPIPDVNIRRITRTTLPQRPQKRGEVKLLDCLDIFIGSLAEFSARFRVISGSFCYDYLGHETQMTSTANFKRFVGDLVTYATRAAVTERTRRFLIGDRRIIDGFEAFDNYHMWSVAMARMRMEEEKGKLHEPGG